MRVLFVSPFLPYPPVAGGHRQIWSWLTRLSQDHEVAFAGFYEREPEAENAAAIAERCVDTRVRLRRPSAHAYSSWAQIPRWVSEFYSTELAHDIADMTHSFRPEVVQFLHTNMGQYRRHVALIPGEDEAPAVVMTALDLACVAHRRRIAATRGCERLRARSEWLRMLRHEANLFARADHVIAVSETDAALIRQMARHRRVTPVPPGVDREQLASRRRAPEPGRVLYVGHMEHLPNLDGLLFMYKEVWPFVRHQYPSAKLIIAGGGTQQELGRVDPSTLARMERDASVEIAGYLPDLGAEMDRAAAMAAPMRLGSGVRNKVIEAMAAGLPVVTTRIGAEGLAVEHGRELLLADEQEAFAGELVRLFRDGRLRERLSAAGRELVARDHDNDRVTKRLARALMRAVGERA
ncbi:MAG: glycosyltransferase [Armatimonadetes bacterium]|nr:glycosyltransferase [Armatimonadota bacterium]